MFNAHSDEATNALSPDMLTASLSGALVVYPHWAGQLEYTPYEPKSNDHTKRFRRLQISHGAASDPGVELAFAQHSESLASFIPDAATRIAGSGVWNAKGVKNIGLLPDSPPLALYDMKTYEGLPTVIIQVTRFSCGGTAIAIAVAHPLADAQTLLTFVHDWATHNRAIASKLNPTTLGRPSPALNPQAIDHAADGDIDARLPDQAILAQAIRDAPLHRYDWWASAADCPPGSLHIAKVSPELDGSPLVTLPGKQIPWLDWDRGAPVAHKLVYFSPAELQRMWEAARAQAPGARLSRLDALHAHLFSLVARARSFRNDEGPMYFDVSIDVRRRLANPLPETFLGSPLLNIPVTTSGREAASGNTAPLFRAAIQRYDAATLAAVLHEFIYLAAPQRYWNTFLGKRHTILTSWLRLGVYDVEFVEGLRPRYVEAIMPDVDGCIQIMEAGGPSASDGQQKQWYDGGASVSIHMRGDVLESLLGDPWLRKYVSV